MGDTLESFFKRRIGRDPGKAWIPWDQVDFMLGAMIVTVPYWFSSWLEMIMTLVLIFILTVVIQRLGFWLKLKKDPL